jgi:periplasmic copper chaperone A
VVSYDHTAMIRRSLLLSAGSALAALTLASPAFAHIDPDPTEAQAGSTLSVAFTVEHGCEGSPTIQLDMRLPEGVTEASPDPIDGWDGSIEADVVTFVGGPLPDDEEGTFSVTMTLPPTPDTTIYFPFVQRCEVGEIRWIAIPTDAAADEPEEPAPAMLLIGPVATTTAPAETTAPPTTSAAPATTAASSTVAPSVTDAPTSTVLAVVSTDENGSQSTGTWFFVASIAAVLGLGVFVAFRARSARNSRDAS